MSRELQAAMRRHPAGSRLARHTGATIIPIRPVPSLSTATAESNHSEKGPKDND